MSGTWPQVLASWGRVKRDRYRFKTMRSKLMSLAWTSLSCTGAPVDATASSNTSTKLDTWVGSAQGNSDPCF